MSVDMAYPSMGSHLLVLCPNVTTNGLHSLCTCLFWFVWPCTMNETFEAEKCSSIIAWFILPDPILYLVCCPRFCICTVLWHSHLHKQHKHKQDQLAFSHNVLHINSRKRRWRHTFVQCNNSTVFCKKKKKYHSALSERLSTS